MQSDCQEIDTARRKDQVLDFFSFSGNVRNIVIESDQDKNDGSQHAIIVFSVREATETAFLLENALVGNRSISVSFVPEIFIVNEDQNEPDFAEKMDHSPELPNKKPIDEQLTVEQSLLSVSGTNAELEQVPIVGDTDDMEEGNESYPHPAASALASFFADTYDFGVRVTEGVKEASKQIGLTEGLQKTKEAATRTFVQIDDRIKVREAVEKGKEKVNWSENTEKSKQFLSNTGDTLQMFGSMASTKIKSTAAYQKTLSSQPVVFIKDTSKSVGSVLKDIQSETKLAIEEKRVQRRIQHEEPHYVENNDFNDSQLEQPVGEGEIGLEGEVVVEKRVEVQEYKEVGDTGGHHSGQAGVRSTSSFSLSF